MKAVRTTKNFSCRGGVYLAGETHMVPDDVAEAMLDVRAAVIDGKPPTWLLELHRRFDAGIEEPCLFLPYVGEFGHKIMSHIRIVHLHAASHKVVCCQAGNEVLYPSADEFVTDWDHPVPDRERVGTLRQRTFDWSSITRRYPDHVAITAGDLPMEAEVHPFAPGMRIPFAPRKRGLTVDVTLGVRHRECQPVRNWEHWRTVAAKLEAAGLTFAVIGQRDTSLDLPGQSYHSGDYDTDAAIELMQNCKLYVGTDTGSSHLAAAVGVPMLIFRETDSGSRDMTGHMARMNPGNVTIVPNGWQLHGAVSRVAIEKATVP